MKNPYAIWVSEIMLQQTRVETVIPYYERFLEALPTVHALAEAPLERVLELWSGLGYYRRTRLLHGGAKDVCARHRGQLPREVSELEEIPGIGRYTAGAIASIAYGRPAPVVDGNVARVLSRLAAIREPPTSPAGKRRLWSLAAALAQCDAPGDLNQALMELGATVCTPAPACERCPISRLCAARARGMERELPVTVRKTAPRRVRVRAFVVQTRGAVVCGKRAGNALYAGLWEPPILDVTTKTVLGVRAFESRGRFEHVLTHRRLQVEVFHGTSKRPKLTPLEGYERLELVPYAQLGARAMSRLARRVLDLALGDRVSSRRRP